MKIGLRGDEYHRILTKEYLGSFRYVEVRDFSDIRFYLYPSFEEARSVVFDVFNPSLLAVMQESINPFYQYVVWVDRLEKGNQHNFPVLSSFQEKSDFFKERIKLLNLRFHRSEVYQTLLYQLVMQPSKYKDLLSIESLWSYEVTFVHLEELFGSLDRYNLDEVLLAVITNQYKKKSVEQLNYFLVDKQYAPHWLVGKAKEMAVLLDYFYGLYARGVLFSPSSEKDYLARVVGEPIELPSKKFQTNLFEKVKTLPYAKAKQYINCVLAYQGGSILELMMEVRVCGVS